MTIENPPAFPRPSADHGSYGSPAQAGMTLRDYFAGQALQDCASLISVGKPATYLEVAKVAYGLADAMLAARGAL